jgi:cell division transport system ATP-binding protein
MIQFEAVSKRYPSGRMALDGLSFTVETGEMAFLTGHSGAGKSTALKMIGLIDRPTAGRISVAGVDLTKIPRRGIAGYRRRIGMVFQDHKLLYDRPVFDNVALPLVVAGLPFRDVDRRVRAALDQVGLLGRERGLPIELSSGEQQRVGIARAIVTKPAILIADEPTGNLDPDLAVEVMHLFRAFNDVGVTVLIASHDLHLIEQLGARRIALSAGRVAGEARD